MRVVIIILFCRVHYSVYVAAKLSCMCTMPCICWMFFRHSHIYYVLISKSFAIKVDQILFFGVCAWIHYCHNNITCTVELKRWGFRYYICPLDTIVYCSTYWTACHYSTMLEVVFWLVTCASRSNISYRAENIYHRPN